MIHKNPERVAWMVIVSAFVVFLALCALVPLGTRYYLLYSTSPKPALLEVIGGTVRVQERGAAAPIAVTKSKELGENSTIETDENSRGILTFLDGSTATLFPSTQLTLNEMRVSTFSYGVAPVRLALEQTRGRIRIGAAQMFTAGAPSRDFKINTPHLAATLTEGSYAVDVGAEASQVTVRDGNALVLAQDRYITISRGQRTVAARGEAPLAPLPASEDLVVNGDFKDPLARGWSIVREASDPNFPSGTIFVVPFGERQTIRIVRSKAAQNSAITGILQQVNKEVSDFRTLRLNVDLRVHFQSLSGGGILSSEYPLILRMRYRDVYGSEAEWVHGFFIQNATNNPTNNGEFIPPDVWVPFESGNLFDTLDPRPFYITSLQIYASGWDYDSYFTGVRLVIE